MNAIAMAKAEVWKDRERNRFITGDYKPVPVALDYPSAHFVHLSNTALEADYIAYTPSDAYGEADRQVRMKFGRYLRKTFSVMTDSEIQDYVTNFKSALAVIERPAALHFATDIETINRIFETEMNACGSTCVSCMHGKFAGQRIRPYHVYANSPDVAVAYVLTGDDKIIARSVVSTKGMRWIRLYSVASGDNDTDCGTLEQLLKDAGYTQGNLGGNRLTNLNTSPVMLPYIDYGGRHIKDTGKYWLVVEDGEGDYEADCADGTATESGNRCSVCERREDNCECYVCECCNERSSNGCEECSMCEECDGCTQHYGCNCSRCSDCHNIINPRRRYTDSCECDRCGECHKLVDDCDCDKCDECGELTENCTCEEDEDEDEDETTTETTTETATETEARHKRC